MAAPNKSCDLDPLPTWLLKACIDELVPIITRIINASLSSGSVPTPFKSAVIRPLLKKPGLDSAALKHYRSVSNLEFIGKILEKVVSTRLESHLSTHSLHGQHQSTYRQFHSTETALLKVQNDILTSLDGNNVTVLVMLDLSAAFDTIDHETLINRLRIHYGIADEPLHWISSYLSDRVQTVCVDGEFSDPVTLKCSSGFSVGPKNVLNVYQAS